MHLDVFDGVPVTGAAGDDILIGGSRNEGDIEGDGTFTTLAIVRSAFGLSLELAVGSAIA